MKEDAYLSDGLADSLAAVRHLKLKVLYVIGPNPANRGLLPVNQNGDSITASRSLWPR